ncbi:hypothetical protein SDJN03_27133, partial [Cucurbita argyrosperma subsp. sororia]
MIDPLAKSFEFKKAKRQREENGDEIRCSKWREVREKKLVYVLAKFGAFKSHIKGQFILRMPLLASSGSGCGCGIGNGIGLALFEWAAGL